MSTNKINIRFFVSGFCRGNIKLVHPDEYEPWVKFYALWALIEDPALGTILFDTGYSKRFFKYTNKFPHIFYRITTPTWFKEKDSCVNQLAALGIQPDQIDHLVISHFHADHIGGMKDFNPKNIWCRENGMQHILNYNDFWSVTRGYLKKLLPENLLEKARHPEKELSKISLGKLSGWEWTPEISFVDLPGHCRGQIGLFLKNTNYGDVLLAADGAWTSRVVREKIYPSPIVTKIVDDFPKLRQTIDHLHDFQKNNPDVLVVPTHCIEIAKKFVFNNEA